MKVILTKIIQNYYSITSSAERCPLTACLSSHSVLPKELNNNMKYIFGEISWQRSQPSNFTEYICFLSPYRNHYSGNPERYQQLCTKDSTLLLVLEAYFDYLTCLNKRSRRSYRTIRTTSSCSDMFRMKSEYNFPVRRCRSQLKLSINADIGNKKGESVTDVEKFSKATINKLSKPYSSNKHNFISEPNSFEINITNELDQKRKHIKRLTFTTNSSMLLSNESEQVRALLKNGICSSESNIKPHVFPVNVIFPEEFLFEYTLNKKAHSHSACSFMPQNKHEGSSVRNSEVFSDFHRKLKPLRIASVPMFEKYSSRRKKTKAIEQTHASSNENQLVEAEKTNMNEQSDKKKKMFQSIIEAFKYELGKKAKTMAFDQLAAEGLNHFDNIKNSFDFCIADSSHASQQYFKKYFHFKKEINNFEKINCVEHEFGLGIKHSDSKDEALSYLIKYLFVSFLCKFRKFLH